MSKLVPDEDDSPYHENEGDSWVPPQSIPDIK